MRVNLSEVNHIQRGTMLLAVLRLAPGQMQLYEYQRTSVMVSAICILFSLQISLELLNYDWIDMVHAGDRCRARVSAVINIRVA
jgi:acyl dehydratase